MTHLHASDIRVILTELTTQQDIASLQERKDRMELEWQNPDHEKGWQLFPREPARRAPND